MLKPPPNEITAHATPLNKGKKVNPTKKSKFPQSSRPIHLSNINRGLRAGRGGGYEKALNRSCRPIRGPLDLGDINDLHEVVVSPSKDLEAAKRDGWIGRKRKLPSDILVEADGGQPRWKP